MACTRRSGSPSWSGRTRCTCWATWCRRRWRWTGPPAATTCCGARVFVDLVDGRFGPGREEGVCGHPEIETALVELYRHTGERRYLDLAAHLVDLRGHGLLTVSYTHLTLPTNREV